MTTEHKSDNLPPHGCAPAGVRELAWRRWTWAVVWLSWSNRRDDSGPLAGLRGPAQQMVGHAVW